MMFALAATVLLASTGLSSARLAGTSNRRTTVYTGTNEQSATSPPSSALFVLSNGTPETHDGRQNQVLLYDRDVGSGALTFQRAFNTGGIGGIQNGTFADDPIASQDAVVVENNCLFAVNPGSNTVSSFRIVVAGSSISLERANTFYREVYSHPVLQLELTNPRQLFTY